MANMDQHIVSEAKANLKETWEDLFSLVDAHDGDKNLDEELKDPNHPVTILCLYICQIQSFVLREINRANQSYDPTKLKTLGPFDSALG